MTQDLHSLIERPDAAAQGEYALSSELISGLLTSMRLRGVRYRRIHAGSQFGLRFSDHRGSAYFHFVAVGSALLETDDGDVHEVPAGTAVFIPHGKAHRLQSRPGVPVQEIESYATASVGETVSAVNMCPSLEPDPSNVLFTGEMEFDLGGMYGLSKLMPVVMVADAHGERYPGLMPILVAMRHESCTERVGFAGVLARLAEVVASMIVRGWVECGCDNASGLVAALRDPRLAKAILALHQDPGRHWTVAELAAECHVSRSVFAERFQTTIGVTPLRYATELRMFLAQQWLAEDVDSIEVLARRLGYTSQAAFSRAFKRVLGHPPGTSRKLQQQGIDVAARSDSECTPNTE